MLTERWAESLVGLRMKVEDRWWQGYTTTNLNPGCIGAVDFANEHGAIFVFQNDEDGEQYHMRYDAVLKYADEEDRNFYKFHLPEALLADPANEEVTVSRRRRCRGQRHRQRTTRLHNTSTLTRSLPTLQHQMKIQVMMKRIQPSIDAQMHLSGRRSEVAINLVK